MTQQNKLSNIENKTGNLYSDCFEVLNNDQWIAQGELLADQLGLDEFWVKSKRCFDGGCGHGALEYRLAKLGAADVTGFDLHPEIEMDRFKEFLNVRFVQGSLVDICMPDGLFDLVVSSGVVHHTVDPDKAFSEMTRILKPGGRFVLGVYGKHGLFPWCLQMARLFTVRIPMIRESFIRKVCNWLKLDPIWRYQVLDYLYVPILRRFSPQQIKDRFFTKNGLLDVERVSNLTPEKAERYVKRNASYTYDYRKLKSRILFGHGFIVVAGRKP
ncbi:MAG: class I SAM-dependent methyltransferase [Patescibacteria group bacterium]